LIYKDESYAIIGACMAVYKDKGCGFLEPVYHECLEIELELQRIPFLSRAPQTLQYHARTLVQTLTPDFLCYGKSFSESRLCLRWFMNIARSSRIISAQRVTS